MSGNPGGIHKDGAPKARSLSELAREYTGFCVSTLVVIVKKGPERNRLAAAMALLDRGHGKPIQQIDATVIQRKLHEMTDAQLEMLEARLIAVESKPQEADPPPAAQMN